jgi:hypothetical protein
MCLSSSSFALKLALTNYFKTFFKGGVKILVSSLLSCLNDDLLTFLKQILPLVYLTANSSIRLELI